MILYGMASEGFGHLYRSWPIIKLLQEIHDVRVVTDSNMLADRLPQEEYACVHINPIRFKRKHDKIQLLSSMWSAYSTVKGNLKLLENYKHATLCVTDYEPSIAWFAYLNNIPLVTVDNQHRFNYCYLPLSFPYTWYGAGLALFNRWYIPKPIFSIISTFSSDARLCISNAALIPLGVPALPKVEKTKSVVIYAKEPTWNNIQDVILTKSLFLDVPVIVYHKGDYREDGNMVFKPFNRDAFLKDLNEAQYCIGPAGNQLATECNQLNVPMVAVAEDKQVEQNLNSHLLPFGCVNQKRDIERAIKKMLTTPATQNEPNDSGVTQAVKLLRSVYVTCCNKRHSFGCEQLSGE